MFDRHPWVGGTFSCSFRERVSQSKDQRSLEPIVLIGLRKSLASIYLPLSFQEARFAN